jgi:peroxiredoxin
MLMIRRAAYLSAAVGCLAAALLLLLNTGLPQRATYTGQILSNERIAAPEPGAFAPDFERPTLSGSTIRLSELRGAPVVVNFWATWCGPCIVEMPILQSIFETYRETGLRVLAVNLGEPPDVIHTWQQAHQLTYDLLIDPQQQVAGQYHLRGQPSTYVIAPDGRISAIFFGPVSESTLIAALERNYDLNQQ